MRTCCVKNGLVVGVILLFVGVVVQPSIAIVQLEKEIDVEPEDYLFQTIIDIANNPDVIELFEQYENELLKVNLDKRIYRKIFFMNPRLFFDMLFTKPSITIEYLDKCYTKGIEIINILGEDKALEIMESIDFSDKEVIDELNYIIINDEKLSRRSEILKEMNKELNPTTPFRENPILCVKYLISLIGLFFIYGLFWLFTAIFGIILLVSKTILPEFYQKYLSLFASLCWGIVLTGAFIVENCLFFD